MKCFRSAANEARAHVAVPAVRARAAARREADLRLLPAGVRGAAAARVPPGEGARRRLPGRLQPRGHRPRLGDAQLRQPRA